MKYILDTHVALWLFEGNAKLSQTAQNLIFNDKNDIFISIISAWEVAVKISLNKLDFDGGSEAFLFLSKKNNIDLIGMHGDYIKIVENLSYIHRDPFDRFIISSAISENMTIITIDENIHKYAVSWIR